MKTSEHAKEKIKEFEGLRLVAYKPFETEKNYTIGYGHCGIDVGSHQRITKDYADFLLNNDIVRVERQLSALHLTLTQGQHDALVSFVFNLGIQNLKTSTLLKKIKNGSPASEVKAQFARWVFASGKQQPGLVKRRAWEADQWNK